MLATRVTRLHRPCGHRHMLISAQRHKSRFVFPPGEAAYEDDYTDTPNYPPIDPETTRWPYKRMERLRATRAWHDGMLQKETLEEKLMQLNVQRRYGWSSTLLSDQVRSFDSWEFIKFITRTHLMEPVQAQVAGGAPGAEPKVQLQYLPSIYYSSELTEKVAHFKSKLRSSFQDIVKFEMDGIERPVGEDDLPWEVEHLRTTSIVNQISRFLVQELSTETDYLRTTQVDRNPKIEAFWLMGGFSRNERQRKGLRNLTGRYKKFLSVKEDDPIERNMQYDGTSIVQLRTEFPFSKFVDQDVKFGSEDPPTRFPYDYHAYGYRPTLRYATQNAGHWSGCQSRQNLLSIHSTHHLQGMAQAGTLDHNLRTKNPEWIARAPQLLNAQASIASFAKLVAQANVLGFHQWCDVPYPLATQTILTNGIDWSFYTYQLNTFKFDRPDLPKNKRVNVCWSTERMKLLKEDGTVNDPVLDHLLKFYLAPSMMDTSAKFDTPHIKQNLNDIEDEERRNFIFYNFQTMVSQKNYEDPDKRIPEMYQWEKFYKVDHATRPVDSRRRFFELPDDMGPKPYNEPYHFINPSLIKSKRLRFMLEELKEKKEEERIKASYEAQRENFQRAGDDDKTKEEKK